MIKTIIIAAFIGMVGVAAAAVGHMHKEWPYAYQTTTPLNSPKPGQNLLVQVDVNRIKECSSVISRSVYDGAGKRVLEKSYARGERPIGPHTFVVEAAIPLDATPGKSAYCFSQKMECNWVQRAFSSWTKEKCVPFTIAGR